MDIFAGLSVTCVRKLAAVSFFQPVFKFQTSKLNCSFNMYQWKREVFTFMVLYSFFHL